MFNKGDIVKIKKDYLEPHEDPNAEYIVIEDFGDGKVKVFLPDEKSSFGGYTYVGADYMFYKVDDKIEEAAQMSGDFDALENTQEDEMEAEFSKFANIYGVLQEVEDNIQDDKVDFSVLKEFFNFIIDTGNEVIKSTDSCRNELYKIGVKLGNIVNNISKTEFTKDKNGYEILQYSYNAFVMEDYLNTKLGGTFGSDDHLCLHTGPGKNIADFINVPLLQLNEQAINCSVEAKVFGSGNDAQKGLNSEDRTLFHNADYIIYIIAGNGNGYLVPNALNAKSIQLTGLDRLKLSFITITKTANEIKVDHFKDNN